MLSFMKPTRDYSNNPLLADGAPTLPYWATQKQSCERHAATDSKLAVLIREAHLACERANASFVALRSAYDALDDVIRDLDAANRAGDWAMADHLSGRESVFRKSYCRVADMHCADLDILDACVDRLSDRFVEVYGAPSSQI